MSFRKDWLETVEACRSLSGPDFADIRAQVTIRKRTWSGPRIAMGTPTDVDLVLPPHYPIRVVTEVEVNSAGGQVELGDLIVDHITPSDGAGTGYTVEQLKPTVMTDNVEIIYRVTDIDGTFDGEYSGVDIRRFRPFTYQLFLRRRTNTP